MSDSHVLFDPEHATCDSNSSLSSDMCPCRNILNKMNRTDFPTVTELEGADVTYYAFYYTLLFTLTALNYVGNSVVLVAFCRHQELRSPRNCFFLALAATDILRGFSYSLYNLSHMKVKDIQDGLGYEELCYFMVTAITWCQVATSYHLVAITVQRYAAVAHPLALVKLCTWRNMSLVSLVIWLCSLVFSVVLLVSFLPDQKKPFCLCRYELIFTSGRVLINALVNLVLPLSLMTLLYARTACLARSRVRRISALSDDGFSEHAQTGRLARMDAVLTRVPAILLVSFVLAWLPTYIFLCVSIFHPDLHINRYIRACVRLILHANSAINVVIYAGSHPDFRQAFQRDQARLCPCCHNKVAPPSDGILQTCDLQTLGKPQPCRKMDYRVDSPEISGLV